MDHDFLNRTPKAQVMNEKKINWTTSKSNFCALKNITNNEKETHAMKENICESCNR